MISLTLVCKVILDLLEYFKDFMALQIFLAEGGVRASTHKVEALQTALLRPGICEQEGRSLDLLIGEKKEAGL